MGLRGLERDMEAMRQTGRRRIWAARSTGSKVEQLRDAVRDFVVRALLASQGRDGEVSGRTAEIHRLSNIERAIWTGCGVLVRQMAKSCRAVPKTRRRRIGGQLDTRDAAAEHGWAAFVHHRVETEAHRETAVMVLWRRLRLVAAMSGFLLMFVPR